MPARARRRFSARLVPALLAALVGVLAGEAQALAAQAEVEPAAATVARVRGLRAGRRDGAALVEAARTACPTVRLLLDALQHTDVIVLVEIGDRILNRTAHLTFQGGGNGTRYLRIQVDGGNLEVQQVAWLAHELQHAMEVAEATDVQDVKGLGRLFARIGTDLGNGQFETDAAVAVGKQALLEVYAPRPRQ